MRGLTLALLLLGTLPAAAETLGSIKAGEWVMTMDTGDGPPKPGSGFRICYKTDRTFTEADLNRGGAGAHCTTTAQRSGDVVNLHSVCKVAGGVMTTDSVMTHGDNDMSMSGKSHMEGGPANIPADTVMHINWHHTGPCQPGDRAAPDAP